MNALNKMLIKREKKSLYKNIEEKKINVFTGDVGGGFGGKIPPYPEDALLPWLAAKAERSAAVN